MYVPVRYSTYTRGAPDIHLGIELQIHGEVVKGRGRCSLVRQLSDQGTTLHNRHLKIAENTNNRDVHNVTVGVVRVFAAAFLVALLNRATINCRRDSTRTPSILHFQSDTSSPRLRATGVEGPHILLEHESLEGAT